MQKITRELERFDFHAYALELYEFVWNQFCDWYVESAKSAFYGEDEQRKQLTLRVFDYVFSQILRFMHPVMPFVTEELYHSLGYVADADSIMLASWPLPLARDAASWTPAPPADLVVTLGDHADLVDEKFSLIRAGRNLRRTYNIPTNKKIAYFLKPTDDEFAAMLREDEASLVTLLNASELTIDPDYEPEGTVPSAVEKHGLIYMPLAGVIDVEQELQRLGKQRDELEKALVGLDKKLSNEKFLANAPEDVVSRERARRDELKAKHEQVMTLLKELGA